MIQHVVSFVRAYFRHQLPRAAAQISYYLLLSLFPLLLILVSALDYFRLEVGAFSPGGSGVLEDYVAYVMANTSPGMIAAGVATAVTASSAAFRALLRIAGEITGHMAWQGVRLFLVGFSMSGVLVLTIVACLLSAVTGRWFLSLLVDGLGIAAVAWVWQWLRFPILFALGVLALTALYRVALRSSRPVWPWAVWASIALVVGTGAFSLFISLSSRYSLVYGSLAGVVALLLWLFVCANILLAGLLCAAF